MPLRSWFCPLYNKEINQYIILDSIQCASLELKGRGLRDHNDGPPWICCDTKREIHNLLEEARLDRTVRGAVEQSLISLSNTNIPSDFASPRFRRYSREKNQSTRIVDVTRSRTAEPRNRFRLGADAAKTSASGAQLTVPLEYCTGWMLSLANPRGPRRRFVVDVNDWIACSSKGVLPDVPLFFIRNIFVTAVFNASSHVDALQNTNPGYFPVVVYSPYYVQCSILRIGGPT